MNYPPGSGPGAAMSIVGDQENNQTVTTLDLAEGHATTPKVTLDHLAVLQHALHNVLHDILQLIIRNQPLSVGQNGMSDRR